MAQSKPIHDIIVDILKERGTPAKEPLYRTVLVQDGYFVGHKYRFDGGHVIWMPETSLVEVYDQEGKLQKSVKVPEPPRAAVS